LVVWKVWGIREDSMTCGWDWTEMGGDRGRTSGMICYQRGEEEVADVKEREEGAVERASEWKEGG
jgi:hypothetical protein